MKMKKIQECLGILEFNIQKGYSLFVSVVMLKNKECEEKKNGKVDLQRMWLCARGRHPSREVPAVQGSGRQVQEG